MAVIPSIVSLSGLTGTPGPTAYLSDWARGELDFSYININTSKRTADGTLRRHHVAHKREISISWDGVPSKDHTLPGSSNTLLGVSSMRLMHLNNPGVIMLTTNINHTTNGLAIPTYTREANADISVMIKEFSWTVKKRGAAANFGDLCTAQIVFEEV